LRDISSSCAAVPESEAKELEEEPDRGESAHLLTVKDIEEVSLVKLFLAIVVELADFGDGSDHHDSSNQDRGLKIQIELEDGPVALAEADSLRVASRLRCEVGRR